MPEVFYFSTQRKRCLRELVRSNKEYSPCLFAHRATTDDETQPNQAIASPDVDTPNVVSAEDNQDEGAGDGQYLTDENMTIKEIDTNPSCDTPSVQVQSPSFFVKYN